MRIAPPSSTRKHREAGFTLIELLVVIAIISLLVSILLPSLNRAKSLAREVVCLSSVKQIGLCCMFYANANNDCMPVEYSEYKLPETPTENILRHFWFNLLSEFAGEKTHQNYSDHPSYYEYPTVFHGCPEWKFNPEGAGWLPGYGLIAPIYENKIWVRTNIFVEGTPIQWGFPGDFSKRSGILSPSTQGWLGDSTGFVIGGDPGQLIYDPTILSYPGFPVYPSWVPYDLSRHLGKMCIVFADGHAQSYSDKMAGWAFSDPSKLTQ